MNVTTAATNGSTQPLANGTRVLNTTDGEPGVVVNGFTREIASGIWVEYEIETAYGIEVWDRENFVLFSEIESDEP